MKRWFNVSVDICLDTDREADGAEVALELVARACREHPEVLDADVEMMWVFDGDDDEEGHEPGKGEKHG